MIIKQKDKKEGKKPLEKNYYQKYLINNKSLNV